MEIDDFAFTLGRLGASHVLIVIPPPGILKSVLVAGRLIRQFLNALVEARRRAID